jgi:hypothetical protein
MSYVGDLVMPYQPQGKNMAAPKQLIVDLSILELPIIILFFPNTNLVDYITKQ